jgi:hypothetical protein
LCRTLSDQGEDEKMPESISTDMLQKAIFALVDALPNKHQEVSGVQITAEEVKYIKSISSSIVDLVATAIRKGDVNLIDIAETALARASATADIAGGKSTAAKGSKVVMTLASFALTTWDFYGYLVVIGSTMGAVAEGAAAGAAATVLAPGAVATLTILGVLFWCYMLAKAAADINDTLNPPEVPQRFNIESKHAAIINMLKADPSQVRFRSVDPGRKRPLILA